MKKMHIVYLKKTLTNEIFSPKINQYKTGISCVYRLSYTDLLCRLKYVWKKIIFSGGYVSSYLILLEGLFYTELVMQTW